MVSDARATPRCIFVYNQSILSQLSRPTPSLEVSNRMRLVKRRHTAVERKLAYALRRAGVSFSTHGSVCGCTPDIVFGRERVVVFVDGDFWHGRILVEQGENALARSFKPSVRKFWVAKIVRNAERDSRQVRILRRNGWAVVRLWEKDVLRDVNLAVSTVGRRLWQRRTKLKLPIDGV
jgi:DNA mismatch endonuclease (patch repair protein)